MKKILARKSGGFTLIELIIVIAVLGILAVAVLSAINPLEQIRKANDARRKSNAAELLNALERYTSSYGGVYPTGFSFSTAGPGTLVSGSSAALLGSELKIEYTSRIDKATDYVYAYSDTNNLAHICYLVESAEQQTKYSGSANYYSVSPTAHYVCLPE